MRTFYDILLIVYMINIKIQLFYRTRIGSNTFTSLERTFYMSLDKIINLSIITAQKFYPDNLPYNFVIL